MKKSESAALQISKAVLQQETVAEVAILPTGQDDVLDGVQEIPQAVLPKLST